MKGKTLRQVTPLFMHSYELSSNSTACGKRDEENTNVALQGFDDFHHNLRTHNPRVWTFAPVARPPSASNELVCRSLSGGDPNPHPPVAVVRGIVAVGAVAA